jgi:hypothetical protein
MKRMIVMALSVILALSIAMPVAFGQVGQSSTSSSGNAGQLVAAWWQWALDEPASQNPLVGSYDQSVPPGDTQCDGNNPSGVWFLAGTASGNTATRTCTAPADTQLFYPVVNTIWVFTDPTDTNAGARDYLDGFMKAVLTDPKFQRTLVVTVDGQPVPSSSIGRADSPFFNLVLPENNLVGLDAGTYKAKGTGLWVTLPPLSEGEHTIHVEWSAKSVKFSQNTTYHLTVG